MYTDRFIRSVNADIFHSRNPEETEIPTEREIAYRDLLSYAMLGFTHTEALHRSVFSPTPPRTSLFETFPEYRAPAPVREVKLVSASPTKILSGPGMDDTLGQPSRLATALGTDTFAIATGNKVFNVKFSANGPYTVRELYDTLSASSIAHVTVIDLGTLSMIAADTEGRIYHLQPGGVAPIIQSGDAQNPITGLFTRDASTFVFGNQEGGITLADLRNKTIKALAIGQHATCHALLPQRSLLAAGSDDELTIFDIRAASRPMTRIPIHAPVTALAWHTNSIARTLFAAYGGKTRTFAAHSSDGGPAPLCVVKTYGVVRSILCQDHEAALITPREHADGKCAVLWRYSNSDTPGLVCTQIGGFPKGTKPSCSVFEKDLRSFIVAFPEDQFFAQWDLFNPPKKP